MEKAKERPLKNVDHLSIVYKNGEILNYSLDEFVKILRRKFNEKLGERERV